MSELHPHDAVGQHPIEKLVDDVEQSQQNTTWPDVMINASTADEIMWKGSPRITKVQRLGVGIFGLVFVMGGVSIVNEIYGKELWWLSIPIGVAFIGVGCRLLWNSVRKNAPSKPTNEDE